MAGSNWIVGRDPACHLHLDNDTVSRQHAELSVGNKGEFLLKDLNSVNGTLLERAGIYMPVGNKPTEMQKGDKVYFGQCVLTADNMLVRLGAEPGEKKKIVAGAERVFCPGCGQLIVAGTECPTCSAEG